MFNVPGLEHGSFIGNRGGGIENDPSKLEKICALDGRSTGCETTPNHGQAAPELVAVKHDAKGTEIQGRVNGQHDTLYRVELFSNNDPKGNEAEHYLGYMVVPINAAGKGSFSYPVKATDLAQAGNFTATTIDGATSPVSRPIMAK